MSGEIFNNLPIMAAGNPMSAEKVAVPSGHL